MDPHATPTTSDGNTPKAKTSAYRFAGWIGLGIMIVAVLVLARCTTSQHENPQGNSVTQDANVQTPDRTVGLNAPTRILSTAATCASFSSTSQTCPVTDQCTGWISASEGGMRMDWFPNDPTVWGQVQYLSRGQMVTYDFEHPPGADVMINGWRFCAPAGRTTMLTYQLSARTAPAS